ncbi:MAG: hypothetical protein HW389_3174 [Bacteroidetes bacterium]|nr:hypothetical protein [Bacteroidota bacterium]
MVGDGLILLVFSRVHNTLILKRMQTKKMAGVGSESMPVNIELF